MLLAYNFFCLEYNWKSLYLKKTNNMETKDPFFTNSGNIIKRRKNAVVNNKRAIEELKKLSNWNDDFYNTPDEDDRDETLKGLEDSGNYNVKIYNITNLSEDMVNKFVQKAQYSDFFEEEGIEYLKTLTLIEGVSSKSTIEKPSAGMILFQDDSEIEIEFMLPTVEFSDSDGKDEIKLKIVSEIDETMLGNQESVILQTRGYGVIFDSFKLVNNVISSVDFQFI